MVKLIDTLQCADCNAFITRYDAVEAADVLEKVLFDKVVICVDCANSRRRHTYRKRDNFHHVW